MKKIIITLAAVAAAFTMASCNKEQLTESEGTPVVGNDVITAFTESTLTKTSLSGNDTDGYEVFWSEGDTFKMGDNTFTLIDGANTTSGKFQGTLPEGDGPFTAYYPATYNGTDWPTSQTYSEGNITGSPMTAEVVKGAESLSFKNAGGILRLTLKGTAKVGSIKVSATGLDEITLDCGSGVALDNTNGTVFHIAMPEGEYSGVSIAVWTTDYDDCTKKLKEGTQLKIERSKITTAAFTASFPSLTSTDPLPGAFSIADGKQVCFSRGNLRYSVASKEWSFYDKQYKCGPLHEVDSKEISLFTWGYNATQSINPIGSASNNVSITSGNLSSAQDWGSVFGDNSPWRTLTSAEWTYLFEGRTNASQKYGYATVGGQKGLIILPDEFTDPMKNGGSGAFKPQSSTASSWTDNYYTLAGNWEAMEAAGAVFLPAAGRRGGDSIATGSNEQGHYWSSSAVDSDKAYFVYFNYNSFDPAYSWRRDNGCSVRLVTDLYTVTFDMNGKIGTAPESLTKIKHGSTITKPSDPTAKIIGYEFAGWYKDVTCTQAWNFASDKVTSNITLYAKWDELPIRAIQGKFTVNDEGKQVYFAAGNLRYTIASGTWSFFDRQYDCGPSTYESGHSMEISLFVWGYNSKSIRPDGQDINYQDITSGNLSQDKDWGSRIGDGKTWRTLTYAEWQYLFETRTNATSKYGYGTVCGVNGLIILPDEFTDPMKNGGSGAFVSGAITGWDANVYTTGGNWEAMESAGAVFLPAAGNRTGTTIYSYGRGYYWSSTGNTQIDAPLFHFAINDFDLSAYGRYNGGSIRLVTEVK